MDVRLRLDDYLNRHDLSAYRLAQAVKGRAALGSIYALARGDLKRLDLNTLAAVIEGLEQLTGQPVTFDDLLERVDPAAQRLTAAGVPYTGDPETDAVLNDHPDILERVGEHKAGETKSRPLRQLMSELGLE